MEQTLIYAVDDEASIRELYEATLASGGYLAKSFEDGASLFASIKREKPDLIILDVMLEGASGFDILKTLQEKEETKNIPVIMVSAKGDELSKVKGLDMGASDYLAKPFGVLELLARIKSNLRKKKKEATSYKDITLDVATHEVMVAGKRVSLRVKEFELLAYLLKHQGELVSREQLYKEVWGYLGEGVESRTIDVQINSLRKKLSSSSSKINTIRGVGYLLK